LAAELGLAEISHLEGFAAGGARRVEGMLYLFCQLTHARLLSLRWGQSPRRHGGQSPFHSSFIIRRSSILLPRRDEQPGPLGVSGRRQHVHAHAEEPGALEPLDDLRLREAEPLVAKLLAIRL